MSAIFWHRRDLRIEDNAGLYKALKNTKEVQPIFIFDKNILDKLPKNDQRVLFIHSYLSKLKKAYQEVGSDVKVFYGKPLEIIPQLAVEWEVDTVFTNRDYEPYALERDKRMFELLKEKNIDFTKMTEYI